MKRFIVHMRPKPSTGLYLCVDYETALQVSQWLCTKHGAESNIEDDFVESRMISIDYGGCILGAWSKVELELETETIRFWPHQLYTLMADLHKELNIERKPFVKLRSDPYPLCIPHRLAAEILQALKDKWDEHLEREASSMLQWDKALETLADSPYMHHDPDEDMKH